MTAVLWRRSDLGFPLQPRNVVQVVTEVLLGLPLLVHITFAADTPKLRSIPTEPIAKKKKELLFSDDFKRAELGKDQGWAIVIPAYSLENGTLTGTQMRFDTPAMDGKPAVKGHQAVIGNDIPTKDGVIEFRFKPGGAKSRSREVVKAVKAVKAVKDCWAGPGMDGASLQAREIFKGVVDAAVRFGFDGVSVHFWR